MKPIKTYFLLAVCMLMLTNLSAQPAGEFLDPKVDHFWIAILPGGGLDPGQSGGIPDDPGETGIWELYTDPATGLPWWNIWFYNDPLDVTRKKQILMGFWVENLLPGIPINLYYVFNWSNPQWPGGPIYPHPPDEAFIVRSPMNELILPPGPPMWVELFWEIPDYNPEWVSVDIWGENVWISVNQPPPPENSPLFPWWLANPGPGGTIVHECMDTGGGSDSELGDAPEGDTAYLNPVVIGNFPTCVGVGPANSHVVHGCPNALFFGGMMDCEPDGNAGYCPTFGPNWYNMDECGPNPLPYPIPPPPILDEGLMFPVPYTILMLPGTWGYFPCVGDSGSLDTACNMAVWGQDLDIWINGGQAIGGFFNVLFDWNHDGDWKDTTYCDGTAVPEHVLVDFPIPPGYIGPVSALVPPSFQVGPLGGFAWSRFTLSEIPVGPGWDGHGNFADGETEDYLLQVIAKPEIPLANWPIILAIGLIAILTVVFWWRKK